MSHKIIIFYFILYDILIKRLNCFIDLDIIRQN